MATLLNKPYPLPVWTFYGGDWRESEHEKAFQALLEGDKPIIKFSVADGFAHYLVVSMKPLRLQHIPYGDGYMVPYAMIRGLRKADVEAMIERKKNGWNF